MDLARRCQSLQAGARQGSQSERPVAFLWDATGQAASFVCLAPLATRRCLDPEPELPMRGPSHSTVAPRWVGVLPYEAFRALEGGSSSGDTRAPVACSTPYWTRYGVCVRIDEHVAVLGENCSQVEETARALLATSPEEPKPTALAPLPMEPGQLHVARIERALEQIRAGEFYEVNLARRLRYRATGAPLDLLASMATTVRPAFGGLVETGSGLLVSTSPELLLEVTPDGRARTTPIKGTRPRAREKEEDRAMAAALDADPKERAELAMTIDVERNDLGRVCSYGSVRVSDGPRVSPMGPVWHRHATVEGLLRSEVSREEAIAALLPSGSVTGAPKVRAMQAIAELESARRGAYTGGFGCIDSAGGLRLGMAIRCLELCETPEGSEAHYWVGGGIVLDSDPARELSETEWKAQQLRSLLR